MGTSGFWGVKKNNDTKLIYMHFDSYPSGLGKSMVFAIQNGLQMFEDFFNKVIMVRNISVLSKEERKFILISPSDLVIEKPKEKYFSDSAKEMFEEDGYLEYGYVVDLDCSKFILYKNKKIIGELELQNTNYLDMEKIFDIV